MRLRVELQWQALGNPTIKDQDRAPAGKPHLVKAQGTEAEILPTLFGKGYGTYPVRRANFAVSVAMHALAALLLAAMGLMTIHTRSQKIDRSMSVTGLVPYVPPVGSKVTAGGGGGGDAGKLAASRGLLPQAARQQIAAPAVVISNRHPRLAVTPTIVAPDLKLPQTTQAGNPISDLMTPSNGTGVRAGIGSGEGGGVGSGHGEGWGFGLGGGFGGGVFH